MINRISLYSQCYFSFNIQRWRNYFHIIWVGSFFKYRYCYHHPIVYIYVSIESNNVTISICNTNVTIR